MRDMFYVKNNHGSYCFLFYLLRLAENGTNLVTSGVKAH